MCVFFPYVAKFLKPQLEVSVPEVESGEQGSSSMAQVSDFASIVAVINNALSIQPNHAANSELLVYLIDIKLSPNW